MSLHGFITIMSFHLCTAQQGNMSDGNARPVVFLRLAAPHPLENAVENRF